MVFATRLLRSCVPSELGVELLACSGTVGVVSTSITLPCNRIAAVVTQSRICEELATIRQALLAVHPQQYSLLKNMSYT